MGDSWRPSSFYRPTARRVILGAAPPADVPSVILPAVNSPSSGSRLNKKYRLVPCYRRDLSKPRPQKRRVPRGKSYIVLHPSSTSTGAAAPAVSEPSTEASILLPETISQADVAPQNTTEGAEVIVEHDESARGAELEGTVVVKTEVLDMEEELTLLRNRQNHLTQLKVFVQQRKEKNLDEVKTVDENMAEETQTLAKIEEEMNTDFAKKAKVEASVSDVKNDMDDIDKKISEAPKKVEDLETRMSAAIKRIVSITLAENHCKKLMECEEGAKVMEEVSRSTHPTNEKMNILGVLETFFEKPLKQMGDDELKAFVRHQMVQLSSEKQTLNTENSEIQMELCEMQTSEHEYISLKAEMNARLAALLSEIDGLSNRLSDASYLQEILRCSLAQNASRKEKLEKMIAAQEEEIAHLVEKETEVEEKLACTSHTDEMSMSSDDAMNVSDVSEGHIYVSSDEEGVLMISVDEERNDGDVKPAVEAPSGDSVLNVSGSLLDAFDRSMDEGERERMKRKMISMQQEHEQEVFRLNAQAKFSLQMQKKLHNRLQAEQEKHEDRIRQMQMELYDNDEELSRLKNENERLRSENKKLHQVNGTEKEAIVSKLRTLEATSQDMMSKMKYYEKELKRQTRIKEMMHRGWQSSIAECTKVTDEKKQLENGVAQLMGEISRHGIFPNSAEHDLMTASVLSALSRVRPPPSSALPSVTLTILSSPSSRSDRNPPARGPSATIGPTPSVSSMPNIPIYPPPDEPQVRTLTPADSSSGNAPQTGSIPVTPHSSSTSPNMVDYRSLPFAKPVQQRQTSTLSTPSGAWRVLRKRNNRGSAVASGVFPFTQNSISTSTSASAAYDKQSLPPADCTSLTGRPAFSFPPPEPNKTLSLSCPSTSIPALRPLTYSQDSRLPSFTPPPVPSNPSKTLTLPFPPGYNGPPA